MSEGIHADDFSAIIIAALALTIFHPGLCFPQLAGRHSKQPSLEVESIHGSETTSREDRSIPNGQKSIQVSTVSR